jgi:hypothetical protein
MGEHRALGRACCARGVDEYADIVGRALGYPPVERGLRVGVIARKGAAAFAELFERHQLGLAIVPQPLHVDADDRFQCRQALIVGERVQHLVGLLLVAGDDHARAGVTHNVLQFDPWIGRIDADGDGADHLGAEVGVKPFRRVLTGDGDAVAGLDAERHQPQRDGAGGLVIMGPGVGVPDAVVLFAQRKLVAIHGGALAQQLRNGDRGVLQGGVEGCDARVRCGLRRAGGGWLRGAHGVDDGHQALTLAASER